MHLQHIIFMNSISKLTLSKGTKLVLYADNVLMYKPITSNSNCGDLKKDVDTILRWIESCDFTPTPNSPDLGNLYQSADKSKISSFHPV